MDERYDRFNEITFEAYCKAAIDKGVLKERQRKAKRAEKEVSFSALSDIDIEAIPTEDEVVECVDEYSVRDCASPPLRLSGYPGSIEQARRWR